MFSVCPYCGAPVSDLYRLRLPLPFRRVGLGLFGEHCCGDLHLPF